MNRRIVFLVALFAALALLIVLVSAALAGPPPSTPPSPPKTVAQIASEAYALQATINAAAGRKTNAALDGTAGTRTALTNPNTHEQSYVDKSGACSADSELMAYPATNGCDGDDNPNGTSTWISANVPYPHWFTVAFNLSSVDGVAIVWGNYPSTTFQIQCFEGGVFVSHGNFTAVVSTLFTNTTYYLTSRCASTTQLRIYGFTQSPTGTDFMGLFEAFPFRYYPQGVHNPFDSSALGMGDWTSQLTSITWTESGSNITGFVRVSNNSDLSAPSAWQNLTNSGDLAPFSLVAGYVQYRFYMNATNSSVADTVVHYTGQSSGDPPSKTAIGQIAHDSVYRHTFFNLTVRSDIILPQAYRNITFSDSYVSENDSNGLLGILDQSNANAVGPSVRLGVFLTNSTFTNSSQFFNASSPSGSYRSGFVDYTIDNSTIQNYDSFWQIGNATAPVQNAPIVHDTDITNYNRGNLSYAAIPNSYVFNRVRTLDPRSQDTTFNGGLTDRVREAKYNYMVGGFLQFVYGSDGQGIATGNGTPTEYVNWSFNYAQASRHTVFGTYGTAFGHFAEPTLRGGYYQTIYSNYLNNSRYIAIQSSGNVSGLRIIGNYLQGTSPSFTEGIGVFEQVHDYVISQNYLWNMNTSNNRGIDVGCFSYNMTVSDNLIYDVGTWHLNFECMALKYKNSTGADKSDYSWKGMTINVSRNYLSGASIRPAIGIDSGYIHFDNNTITNASAGDFEVTDGWGCELNVTCDVDSYVWADWMDGYPSVDRSRVLWPAVSAGHEKDFWIRDLRSGNISLRGSASSAGNLSILSTSAYWGNLSAMCLQGTGNATALSVLNFTGHSCGPILDTTTYAFAGITTKWVLMPKQWTNKTLSTDMGPSGNVTSSVPLINASIFIQDVTRATGQFTQSNADAFNWTLASGDDYVVTFPYNLFIMESVSNSIWLFVFVAILVLTLIGAWKIKAWRGGN